MFSRNETWEAIKVLGIWRIIWYHTGYRPFMGWAHKHQWHHTRKLGPFPDGSTQLWCEWCGLRYQTKPIDYARVRAELAGVGKNG